jgi:hypothetical protein
LTTLDAARFATPERREFASWSCPDEFTLWKIAEQPEQQSVESHRLSTPKL